MALTPTRLHSDRDIQVSRAITARRAICRWGEEADNSGSCLSSTNNPVSPPLRESYCFNMNNDWFNLSSGCQRTARRDYFLGTAVTFIGFESGRIGERPLLGRSGWMTDTDGRRKEDRERGKAGFAHLDEQQHAILLDWEIQYSDLDWSKKGEKKQRRSNPPTHRKVTKTHQIEGRAYAFLAFHFITFSKLIIRGQNIQLTHSSFSRSNAIERNFTNTLDTNQWVYRRSLTFLEKQSFPFLSRIRYNSWYSVQLTWSWSQQPVSLA